MKAITKYGRALRLASTTQLTREQWLAIRKLGNRAASCMGD
jgi:hypothetical protein